MSNAPNSLALPACPRTPRAHGQSLPFAVLVAGHQRSRFLGQNDLDCSAGEWERVVCRTEPHPLSPPPAPQALRVGVCCTLAGVPELPSSVPCSSLTSHLCPLGLALGACQDALLSPAPPLTL